MKTLWHRMLSNLPKASQLLSGRVEAWKEKWPRHFVKSKEAARGASPQLSALPHTDADSPPPAGSAPPHPCPRLNEAASVLLPVPSHVGRLCAVPFQVRGLLCDCLDLQLCPDQRAGLMPGRRSLWEDQAGLLGRLDQKEGVSVFSRDLSYHKGWRKIMH